MSVYLYRREVEHHQEEIVRITQEKAREERRAAAERNRAHEATMAVSRSSSLSTIHSKLLDAQRHEGNAVDAQKNVAELGGRIAREHARLNEAATRLSTAHEQLDKCKAADFERGSSS
jgi:hypothetical protein